MDALERHAFKPEFMFGKTTQGYWPGSTVIGTMILLMAIGAYPQVAKQVDDREILEVVGEARKQVDDFVDLLKFQLNGEIQQGTGDTRKASELLNRIELEDKSEKNWEKASWTIPYSELVPGELIATHLGTFVWVSGTVATCRKRFPNMPDAEKCIGTTGDASYLVEAPLNIKADILMKGLRQAISHYTVLENFEGKLTGTEEDPFKSLWNAAWFDARNVFCRRSPGAEYRDLSAAEQKCR